MPTATLSELRSILGDWMLGELVGLPTTSVATTDITKLRPEVSARIELIGQVVWCLLGAYDEEGIRRWFGRRRPQLKGQSPAEHLGFDWLANSPPATRILELARELAPPRPGEDSRT